ncbi:MAG: hypothetical protein ACPGVA_10765 [Pikeienuella sp.]
MPITITQTPDMPDGVVAVTATSAAAGAEMRITRLDMGAPRYLDPRQTGAAAWGAADVWFRPEPGAGGGLALGPEVTWHLKPHMPYAVSFRGADGVVVDDRMVWKALRLPSTAPPPSQAGGVDLKPSEPEPEAPLEDDLAAFVAEPVTPPVAPTIEPRPEPAPEGGSKMWVIAVLLILLLAAGGYYAAFVNPGFLNDESSPVETVAGEDPAAVENPAATPEPDAAPKPVTLAWAREFLQSNPSATDAAAEAERFAKAGEDSAAFLLRRYAARQGDASSATALGDMYAPDTWKAGVIKAPDAAQALSYYEQAGAKGDVAALEKAIALVESGKAVVADKAATLLRLNDALTKAKESQ